VGLAACHSACGSALRVCVGACVRTRAAWVRACPLTRREEHGTANGGTDRITNRRRTGRGSGRRAMGSCRTTHNAQRAMQHASTHPRIHARARKHARDTCTHTHATSRVHLTSKRAGRFNKTDLENFPCCFGDHAWVVAAAATCQPPTGLWAAAAEALPCARRTPCGEWLAGPGARQSR
jgi:hypothetical protein